MPYTDNIGGLNPNEKLCVCTFLVTYERDSFLIHYH